MLDDYKESQEIAYNVMMNEIKNNHISHAYLIDENDNIESFNVVMAFVKQILVYNLDKKECDIICQKIDDGNYPEIKVIEPDGILIKKQQILNLQQDFSKKAIEGTRRIYIIRDVDKMRNETANSMLKFLEEPDNDIIAILMTNNFNNLLPTIVSRCQIIRLANENLSISDDEIFSMALNFIKNIENNGIDMIAKEKELFFDIINIKDRNKLIYFFDKIIDLYYDILKISIGSTNIKYSSYFNDLNVIAGNNSTLSILNNIDYLLEAKDSIKNNVNINLLFDSIIIKIGGKNEVSWS